MEEARFSYTTKDRAGNLLTVRGDTAQEFVNNVADLNSSVIAALVQLNELANGGAALTTILQTFPHAEVIKDEPIYAPSAQELPSSINPPCKDCGAPTRYEEWIGKNGKNAGKQFKAYKCTRDKDHRPDWLN
jgi:hypothetical protein